MENEVIAETSVFHGLRLNTESVSFRSALLARKERRLAVDPSRQPAHECGV
jgi:hypothetical protein